MNENVLNEVSINSFTADLEVSDAVNEGEIIVKNGHSPYIGTNGNWYEYDDETEEYTDTEVKAEGPQGPRGETGPAGTNGTDGAPGTPGTNGVSPTVSTAAITGGTAVTITDVNGPHTFNVMNGQPGQNGQDGKDGINGTDGKDGADGKDGKDGINGTDGSDGADGVSPAITITEITGGHAITITDALHPNGQTFNVMDGSDGQDGADGSDYVLTAQDKADIAALVVQLIPEAEGSGF